MLYPRKGTNTVGAVFVGDPEGKIRLTLYYPQEIGRNMDDVVRAFKALKLSDELGLGVPDGWPNNEPIGDRVIVPPAKTQKDAGTRRKA